MFSVRRSYLVALLLTLNATQTVLADGGGSQTSDLGWPRRAVGGGYEFSIFPPQVETWQGDQIQGRLALSVKPINAKTLAYGVVELSARTHVDKSRGLVALDNVTINNIEFPTADASKIAALTAVLEKWAAGPSHVMSLERLTRSFIAAGRAQSKPTVKSKSASNVPAPIVFTSAEPAALVVTDGPPVWRAVPNTAYQRVINTNAWILKDAQTGTLFLAIDDRWLTAQKLEGSWGWSSKIPVIPPKVRQEIENEQQANTRFVPAPTFGKGLTHAAPKVFLSSTPATLVRFSGPPRWNTIKGTGLKWIENANAPVFSDATSATVYAVFAGRWFRTKSLQDNKWTMVSSKALPADFKKIPEDHPTSVVLGWVSGTAKSEEWRIRSTIVETAIINRNKAQFILLADGAPRFEPLAGTKLTYSINTAPPIIRTQNGYYSAQKGVWFTASSQTGPWQVASQTPPGIETIASDSPLYYMTFVKTYASDENTVKVGYQPGYLGVQVNRDGVLVWGPDQRGKLYAPWIGSRWFARPTTFGMDLQRIRNTVGSNVYERWASGVVVPSVTRTTIVNVAAQNGIVSERPKEDLYAGKKGQVYKRTDKGYVNAVEASKIGREQHEESEQKHFEAELDESLKTGREEEGEGLLGEVENPNLDDNLL